MRNDSETRGIPDIVLEQYRLNELPPEGAARISRALATDSTLRERLTTLERSDAEIARTYPPSWLAARIRERQVDGRRDARSMRRWILPVALGTAAATLAFTVPAILTRADNAANGTAVESEGGDRIKGLRPSLVVYRRTDRGSETLADGAVAKPGDLLRLGYSAGERAYGVILSVDAHGTVTRHLPVSGARAAPLAHERVNLLDTAFELDDVPGWERFYFIASDTAFDVAPILDMVRQTAATQNNIQHRVLALPPQFDQFVFVLQKEARP